MRGDDNWRQSLDQKRTRDASSENRTSLSAAYSERHRRRGQRRGRTLKTDEEANKNGGNAHHSTGCSVTLSAR